MRKPPSQWKVSDLDVLLAPAEQGEGPRSPSGAENVNCESAGEEIEPSGLTSTLNPRPSTLLSTLYPDLNALFSILDPSPSTLNRDTLMWQVSFLLGF